MRFVPVKSAEQQAVVLHRTRRLLVLGATAVIRHARTKTTPETAWLRGVLDRRPARLASVAQANKTARIVWALLIRGEGYRAPAMAQPCAA